MAHQKWDIVEINFPFTDGSGDKTRPAVICAVIINDAGGDDVILCAITSQNGIAPEVQIPVSHAEYPKTGLRKSSRILPGKIFTVARKKVLCKRGELGTDLSRELKNALKDILL